MGTFVYKARDPQGQLSRGMIDAADEIQAAGRVEQLGLSPILISPSAAPPWLGRLWNKPFRKISHQEVLIFTRQLATLMTTGLPLVESLQNVYDQTSNIRFKQMIRRIMESLKSGISFSEALVPYQEIFGDLYVSLVKVGGTGGMLDKVLNRLADLATREMDLRSRLRSALVYPFVLAGVAFLMVNFVLVAVLPKFVAIFEASSAKLPLPTKILLGLSDLVRNFWWLLGLGVIFFLGWFQRYYRCEAGRFQVDNLILHLPLFGALILKVLVARLCRSVAALTKSGIPVLDALGVVEATFSNAVLQRIIGNVRLAISQGQSLTEPFKASGLFPAMVIQLINTGERGGRLDEMFDQIAAFYEPEVETTVRNLTSLLEPAMLLGMGLVVAFIALSVLLPIFNLISIIRR